jgi:hypothetical protein
MDEEDDYETFLENWEPSESLLHASLSQHVDDPLISRRLVDDDECGKVRRIPYAPGIKGMSVEEERARRYLFFVEKQPKWSAEFEDLVCSNGVPRSKFDTYVNSFARVWVDGSVRQSSPQMLAIKASIQAYDQARHQLSAGRYVVEAVSPTVTPLLTVDEVEAIFAANSGLMEALLPDYIDALGYVGPGSLGDLYVHRGVHMPVVGSIRQELHYLSSFSLAVGPVEQFAQTWTPQTRRGGVPSIFSAPLPAIQERVVAFAPFISSMTLRQLELVVAPPVVETKLSHDGTFGRIEQFSFR